MKIAADQIQQQDAGKPILILGTLGKSVPFFVLNSLSVGNDLDLSFEAEDVVALPQNVP